MPRGSVGGSLNRLVSGRLGAEAGTVWRAVVEVGSREGMMTGRSLETVVDTVYLEKVERRDTDGCSLIG